MRGSLVYTLDGDIEPLHPGCGDRPFFRKTLQTTEPESLIERRVCKLLFDTPKPNVVSIYDVAHTHIDQELLDVDHEDTSTRKHDICKAIEQLHSLNVVYVDLKFDNMGYSHSDGVWKLFDFNGCGIVHPSDRSQWITRPPPYFNYIKHHQDVSRSNMFMFDWVAYDCLFSSCASAKTEL